MALAVLNPIKKFMTVKKEASFRDKLYRNLNLAHLDCSFPVELDLRKKVEAAVPVQPVPDNLSLDLAKDIIEFAFQKVQSVHRPKLFATMGPPAAGKTTFRLALQKDGTIPANCVINSFDDFRPLSPEYVKEAKIDPQAADKNWAETCRWVSEEVIRLSIYTKTNLAWDTTLIRDNDRHIFKQVAAKKFFNTVRLFTLVSNLDDCTERASERLQRTNRLTPISQIQKRFQDLPAGVDQILSLANSLFIFEAQPSQAPRLIGSVISGQFIAQEENKCVSHLGICLKELSSIVRVRGRPLSKFRLPRNPESFVASIGQSL